MLEVMSALLFGCRDIHGRILARKPRGPRKGAATGLPLERSRWPWTVLNVLPAAGHGGHVAGETEPRAARPERCPLSAHY